jgi:prepilin-type N-terminal cleavage/methylation domain-containing protein
MHRQKARRPKGFTLLEMMIAMALGAVVLAAAVEMFSRSVRATWLVSQRAEMQQDFRAAANMLTKDASLAGAGMGNNVAIALPAGPGIPVPVYGCDQIPKCYINGGAVAYPTQVVNGVTVPYLYGLLPGYRFGPTINAAGGPTDVLTVVNSDTGFYLSCYNVKVTSNTVVLFTLPNPLGITCVLPPPMVAPQKVDDPVVGLTPGDLLQFQVTTGVGNNATSSTVMAEVTNVATAPNSPTGELQWNVTFAAGDPLKMNQPAAATGSLNSVVNYTGSANRINVISYYIDNSIVPPRLMRQNSGHTPMPLAENIAFLRFSYDLYDSTASQPKIDQDDGGAALGLTPNQITKINIKHMSVTSTLHGSGGFQGLDLQTSVSARDLTFKNDYPLSSGP